MQFGNGKGAERVEEALSRVPLKVASHKLPLLQSLRQTMQSGVKESAAAWVETGDGPMEWVLPWVNARGKGAGPIIENLFTNDSPIPRISVRRATLLGAPVVPHGPQL